MSLRAILLLAICTVSSTGGLLAQDANEKPAPKPITTLDPAVPREQLRLMVRPLTKSELEVEATAWFELLRRKSRQIAAARLGLAKTNEALAADDDQAAQASLETAETVKESADSAAAATEQKLTEAAAKQLSGESSPENVASGDPSSDPSAENGSDATDDSEATDGRVGEEDTADVGATDDGS